MARKSRPLTRSTVRRPERSRILVVCEGEVTEVEYLQGLKQVLQGAGVSIRSVDLRGHGSDPLNVVHEAARISAEDEFDETWAVVDVDEHSRLPAALVEARRSGVRLVVSNPCFEIWLLWHYDECRAYQSSDTLRRELRKYGHVDPKHLPARFPYDRFSDAQVRANHIPVSHNECGDNPSSAMPQLIDALHRR